VFKFEYLRCATWRFCTSKPSKQARDRRSSSSGNGAF
jgi:hypothetical protein